MARKGGQVSALGWAAVARARGARFGREGRHTGRGLPFAPRRWQAVAWTLKRQSRARTCASTAGLASTRSKCAVIAAVA